MASASKEESLRMQCEEVAAEVRRLEEVIRIQANTRAALEQQLDDCRADLKQAEVGLHRLGRELDSIRQALGACDQESTYHAAERIVLQRNSLANAPDLLAKLGNLVMWASHSSVTHNLPQLTEALKAARAAVAKASGEGKS